MSAYPRGGRVNRGEGLDREHTVYLVRFKKLTSDFRNYSSDVHTRLKLQVSYKTSPVDGSNVCDESIVQ